MEQDAGREDAENGKEFIPKRNLIINQNDFGIRREAVALCCPINLPLLGNYDKDFTEMFRQNLQLAFHKRLPEPVRVRGGDDDECFLHGNDGIANLSFETGFKNNSASGRGITNNSCG